VSVEPAAKYAAALHTAQIAKTIVTSDTKLLLAA